MSRMISILPLPLLLVATAVNFIQCTHAFSAASDGIKIVGLPGGQTESLPGMYVNTFRRWIVEDNQLANNDGEGTDKSKSSSCASSQMEAIKGAGLAQLDEGWVNPTTTNELWWPRDLTTLQIRPMLSVLFRNGMLSYVSAGLDVRVPQTQSDGSIATWRNYGLNSQPIARQWTTLDIALEKIFHMEGFLLMNNNQGGGEELEEKHELLFESLDTKDVMERVANFIAELDSLSPIAEGFHITSFPIVDSWTDLPSPGNSNIEDTEDGDQTEPVYKIVCMATSEPFASKLLDMDEDILTMSSTSVLEVGVVRTVEGWTSEYLPEPYKPLYMNVQ